MPCCNNASTIHLTRQVRPKKRSGPIEHKMLWWKPRHVLVQSDDVPLDLGAAMLTAAIRPPADVADRVIDLGFLPDDERNDAFAAADAYLQPSQWEAFSRTYLRDDARLSLRSVEVTTEGDLSTITAQLLVDGTPTTVTGEGNGPVSSFTHGLRDTLGFEFDVVDYHEHAVGAGADATAVCYVECKTDMTTVWGVGMHENIVTASLRAVVSAANRLREAAGR